MSGIFPVSTEDIIVAVNTDFVSSLDPCSDFVLLFPPELCNKLFSYLTDKDVFSCSQCSIQWRHVINNNAQWRLRCIRKGWYKVGEKNDPYKWNGRSSHVGEQEFQFRQTPLFSLPRLATLRIEELCDWAKFYRQCYFLECSWKIGRYIVHKLNVPECVTPTIYNTCDCNGKIFAAGTTMGYILIWSVEGRPTFIKSILAVRKRIEVEQLHVTDTHMIVVCQTGLMQCYNISEQIICGKKPYEILFQLRIGGHYINEDTYSFHLDLLTAQQVEDIYQLGGRQNMDDDILVWVREMFRVFPWLENDYMVCDIFFSIRAPNIILSGISSNSLYILDMYSGKLIKRIELPPASQICYKTAVKGNKIYLSVRRVRDHQTVNFTFHLLVYDLNEALQDEPPSYTEFPARSMLEEIRSDAEDKRLVWVTQDSVIEGKDLVTQATLFVRQGHSYIDNLIVEDDAIIYHQYDGFIIAIDWDGNQMYEIEMRIGIVRGLKSFDQFLISGGDAKSLFVWNNKTGILYHKVHHQPCRIEFLFADDTKIITLGREDPPVLVGYW